MLEIKISGSEDAARIVVVGVGSVGNNAVNRMIGGNITRVEFISINTDKQTLQSYKAPTIVQIGEKLAKGPGAGTRSEVGEKAAEGSSEEISQALKGTNMVSVIYGMSDGTGTGAAPVVTKIVKGMGILTVGVVTKPFRFEAKTRMNNALSGIEQLKNSVDTLIVIPNDRLLEIVDRRTTMPNTLKGADEALRQTVQGITDLINVPSLINLDFIDVQIVIIDKGTAHTGIGKAKGDDKAVEVVKQAVSSPLLGATIEDTGHVIINISGDISLIGASEAASYVQELAGDEANVIFGAMFDGDTQDEATITIVTTGLDGHGTSASAAKVMTGFTGFRTKIPTAGAPVGQQARAAAPEAAATASAPYTSRPASQGYTAHGYSPAGGGQGYTAPKYNPNRGYAGDSQNSNPSSVTTPSQPFRPVTNKEMQINIPDFLKSKR